MEKHLKIVLISITSLFILTSLIIIYTILSVSEKDCTTFSVDSCPKGCVVCPPCEECSSISCQSESFCNSIGYEKEWYADIMVK